MKGLFEALGSLQLVSQRLMRYLGSNMRELRGESGISEDGEVDDQANEFRVEAATGYNKLILN